MSKKFKKVDLFHLPSTNSKVEKFINFIMKDGKKTVAKRLFSLAMDEIKSSWHTDPLLVRESAIENASPNIMVKSKRIGWANYAIPMEVKWTRRFFYGCKWILDAARWKKWHFPQRLTKELLEAYTWQWVAVKKKEETHKIAESNKANAHLAKYV
jgi:small subunit ribosomal protein S7